jgi:hypothetical protein
MPVILRALHMVVILTEPLVVVILRERSDRRISGEWWVARGSDALPDAPSPVEILRCAQDDDKRKVRMPTRESSG